MNEIFEKKRARTIFFITSGLLITVLFLIRYIIMPMSDKSIPTGWLLFWSNLVDSISRGLISSIIISLFVYFMTPETIRKSKLEAIEQKELKEIFANEVKVSEEWWYKGGCGRFTRTSTIPKMASRAREKSERKTINIVILNPENDLICSTHASFRSGTAAAKYENIQWTTQYVKNQLYSTIITAKIYQKKEPLINIRIHLISHYSAYRIDVSKNHAILTKEDRDSAAIKLDADSLFYKSFKDDIILSQEQGTELLPQLKNGYDLSSISATNIKSIFQELELNNDGLNEADYDQIAKICKEAKNPYG